MENNPGPQELKTLLGLFAQGRYPEAATRAQAMTAHFPLHGFGWKVLGAVLMQMGRSEDALEPLRKAAALLPSDAEARSNLAVTLQDLGRLVEAETCYRQALEIRPEFAEAHYSLGNILRDLGRLEEAEAGYRRALQIKPDFSEAHGNLGFILQALGRLDESAASYRRALQIQPDCAESNYNLGNTLRDLGRLEEAEAGYRQALQIQPDFAEAHGNLGFILQKLGRSNEAEASYRRALQIKPDCAESNYNLGITLQDLGRLEEAKTSYCRALEIKPDFAEAHNNLGVTLKDQGLRDEAVASYRRALEIKPDFADAHCNLGLLLNDPGRLEEALSHYRRALDVSPSSITAQLGISNALSRTVPHWHVPMMNDQRRNNAYFAALESAITPATEVFEIGTGSGLMAMLAAKLGAKRVTSCEAVPLIAKTARRIVADNGYEKSIQVISKQSDYVRVGEDLAQKADILVAEIFSSELLGEHVLPSIEDAKRRLLKEQGRVIPSAGSIMIALFGGNDMGRNIVVEDSFGINLRHFNSIISKKQVIARNDLNVELLTDDIEAFRFDFENDSFFPSQTRNLHIPIKVPGRCYGVIQWIRLQMDQDINFENHPSEKSPVSNWQLCTYAFPEPIDVKPGHVVVVSASHNRIIPWFSLDSIQSA